MTKKGIKISPNYFQKDWRDLDLQKNNLADWSKAILIFRDRIEGRFLKQIDVLDKNPDRKIGLYAGFSVMALDCLLIETIEQFFNGHIRTSRDKGMNEQAFFSFFQRTDNFRIFFDSLAKSDVFYKQIRCGLLHQGQTKGKSLIHIKGSSMLEWIDSTDISKGLSIQRRLFHKEIVTAFENYIAKLENPHDLNFRRKFARKMNSIVAQN